MNDYKNSKLEGITVKDYIKIIKNGLWDENAVLGLCLGLCPALAVTTNAGNGFGMGMALLFVLTASVFIISLVRNFIHEKVRVPFFLAVIAGFVTITDLVLKAYIPPLSKSLGIFIPLIVVNCTVLGRVEVFASKNPPMKAATDGIAMGIGFTIVLVIMGGIREILGVGTFFGAPVLSAISNFKPAIMMILPPGGFLIIGIMMGLMALYKKQQMKSHLAGSKGVSTDDILPPDISDEVTHADITQKP